MSKWTLFAAMAWCCVTSTGCTGPCEELQGVCNFCEDPNHKASCESSVDRDDGDLCDQDVSNYCIVCGRRGATVIEECE